MRTNTQEATLPFCPLAAGGSAYIASIGRRTPRDVTEDAAELCRLASLLNRLNEIACNFGLTERQERRKQNLQTRIKTMLEAVTGGRAWAVLKGGRTAPVLQSWTVCVCRLARALLHFRLN